jgi:hypothetical protein
MLAPPREEGVTPARRAARSVAAAAGVVLLAPVVLTLVIDRDRDAAPVTVQSVEVAAPPAASEMPDAPDMGDAPDLPAVTTTPAPGPSSLPATVLTAEDRAAGLLSSSVPARGSGAFAVVPGRVPAPGQGSVLRIRVEVEKGLPVDAQAFARFVMRTLNDPRGWGARGRLTFARTDGAAVDFRVILASPATNAVLCRPLDTKGEASCGREGRVVVTLARWVRTTPEFVDMPTTYRQYVVNHEMGHLLGHPHERCPRPGAVAPVMQQQTYGLQGCRANPWPYP